MRSIRILHEDSFQSWPDTSLTDRRAGCGRLLQRVVSIKHDTVSITPSHDIPERASFDVPANVSDMLSFTSRLQVAKSGEARVQDEVAQLWAHVICRVFSISNVQ